MLETVGFMVAVAAIVSSICLIGVLIVAIIAIRLSSKKTPHYEERDYD